MSNQALTFYRVFAIQLRLMLQLGWRGRLIGFGLVSVQLIAIVLFGVVLGVSIGSEGVRVAQVVNFSEVFGEPLTRGTAALTVALGALGVIAWFGPFKLWSGEPPRKREYHWAMPVAKGQHDAARVLAGLVLLAGWAAAFYGGVIALALVGGRLGDFAGMTPKVWACLLLGPALSYLLTSFFTVRMEHPSGWLWSIAGGIAAITTFSTVLRLEPIVRVLEVILFGPWGFFSAAAGPVGEQFLGMGRGASAVWPAAWVVWLLLLGSAVAWGAWDRKRLP